MSRKIRKLTPSTLRRIVMKESLSGKIMPAEKVKAAELDADEYGTSKSLENDIDHAARLKIKEVKLRKQLKRVKEARARLLTKISRGR